MFCMHNFFEKEAKAVEHLEMARVKNKNKCGGRDPRANVDIAGKNRTRRRYYHTREATHASDKSNKKGNVQCFVLLLERRRGTRG
jgi:hypothetical protein